MAIIKCKMCGGDIGLAADKTFGTCEYCGCTMTFPKVDDDQRAAAFNRGNHFRRIGEFDKALAVYERIVREDENDAEAHWCCALCRFGIEYVEDPATFEWLPTCHRASFDSFLEDVDYLAAVEHSDGITRRQYQKDAAKIAEVQRGILATSQNAEPYDVFICYKESDESGNRTKDSLMAQDIYYQLTEQGRRVFFARITLEDVAGTQYEPYIFAALNSAKVMVVVGTKTEHLNAVWVKNEWSRFLAMMKKDRHKLLLPCYRDMDPYDLPEQLSVLQSYDMGKIGFIQDLTRGIAKVLDAEKKPAPAKETVVVPQRSADATAPLLKRAFMFLEDGDWGSANEYCEKVLDQDPECAQAYLGKLMAGLQTRKQEQLKDLPQPFDGINNYQKAVRFGDDSLKSTLTGYITHINERNENARLEQAYRGAVQAMNAAGTEQAFIQAAHYFENICAYKDATEKAALCREKAEAARKDAILATGKSRMRGNSIVPYEGVIRLLEPIAGWKDTDRQIEICKQKIQQIQAKEEADRQAREKKAKQNRKAAAIVIPSVAAAIAFVIVLFTVIIPNSKYNAAVDLMESGNYEEAIDAFEALGGYKDSSNKIAACNTAILDIRYNNALALAEEGKYLDAISAFKALYGYQDSNQQITLLKRQLFDLKTVDAGNNYTVCLKADGTVVTAGEEKYNKCNVADWTDIIAISAGSNHTVGLKTDGTVVAVGNPSARINLGSWTDIVAISAGDLHTVGLKADYTVVAVGVNEDGQCYVSDWKDIIAVSAGYNHTVGLHADGTVVATGNNDKRQCDVKHWKNIIAISAGHNYTIGLKADGTVVAAGVKSHDQCAVETWTDIIAISAGNFHTVGLKKDGTVVATGSNANNECDVSTWADIVAISAGEDHTVGLKSDGTVVAVGRTVEGQCDVEKFTDIVLP